VRDGCWPNPAAAKDAVELEARTANVATFNDPGKLAYAHLYLNGLGYALHVGTTKTGCVVYFSISLTAVAAMVIPNSNGVGRSLIEHEIATVDSLFVDPTSQSMQSTIREYAVESATKMFLHVLKTRDKVLKAHPEMKMPTQ